MISINETPMIHDRHLVKQWIEAMLQRDDYKNAFKMPKNLTIITCRNEGPMTERMIDSLEGWDEVSVLEKSMEYLGIDGLVVLKDDRLPWRCTFKFEMINNYLNSGKCKTEYIMFCDAVDVIFKDSPQKVIDIFKSFDCDMLCMSTTSTDGYKFMPYAKAFADKINTSGRYLNSGVYIGKTKFVKEFIEDAFINYATPHGCTMDDYKDLMSRDEWNDFPKGSQDQDIFRYLEQKYYPKLKVDYQNLMAYRG